MTDHTPIPDTARLTPEVLEELRGRVAEHRENYARSTVVNVEVLAALLDEVAAARESNPAPTEDAAYWKVRAESAWDQMDGLTQQLIEARGHATRTAPDFEVAAPCAAVIGDEGLDCATHSEPWPCHSEGRPRRAASQNCVATTDWGSHRCAGPSGHDTHRCADGVTWKAASEVAPTDAEAQVAAVRDLASRMVAGSAARSVRMKARGEAAMEILACLDRIEAGA